MSQDLCNEATDRGIRYFLISFVDLFGVLRAKLVPAAAIGQMQRDGAAFAGFATHLDLTPADPDMFAMPDPASLIQVPWKPEIGWLAADLSRQWQAGRACSAARAEAPARRGRGGGLSAEDRRRGRVFRIAPGRAGSGRRRGSAGKGMLRPDGAGATLRADPDD